MYFDEIQILCELPIFLCFCITIMLHKLSYPNVLNKLLQTGPQPLYDPQFPENKKADFIPVHNVRSSEKQFSQIWLVQ